MFRKIIKPTVDEVIEFENEQSVGDSGIYSPDGRRIFRDHIGHFTLHPTLNPTTIGVEREYIRLNSDDIKEENYQTRKVMPSLRAAGRVAAMIAAGTGVLLVGTGVAVATIFVVATGVASPDSFDLEIHNNFDDGTAMITGDSFFAAYDTNNPKITNGYDFGMDLREIGLPGKNVQIYTIDTGVPLMKDFRVYDHNLPNVLWPMKLVANNPLLIGFNGINHIDIANPKEIDKIPENVLIYFTRYNGEGVAVQNYDLRNPANHSIQWQEQNAIGPYASIDLIIKDKCLGADLNKDGIINFRDLAILLNYWKQIGPNPTDINGDNRTNMKDLGIMADYWLSECLAK